MRRDRIASSLKNGYFMQGKICYYYDTVHGTKNRVISTPKTRFSEPWISEILDLMNKFQLSFSYSTLYPDWFSEERSLYRVLGVLIWLTT